MSTGPRRSVTSPSIRPTRSGSLTSRSTAIALAPEPEISDATTSERSRVRAARATFAPTSARALAKASPRPVLPPVTTAVLPSRLKESRIAISRSLTRAHPAFAGVERRGRPDELPASYRRRAIYTKSSATKTKNKEQKGPKDAADGGSEDRDPAVLPVVATFAGYREYCVGDSRAEIPGGVDGVPRGPAERQTDT